MTELNQKVEQYDLREHVIFLGRRNDIPDLLKMIDILIIPSAFAEDDVDSAADAVGKILEGKEQYKKAGIEFASQMSNREYSTKVEQIFKSIE